MVLQSPGILRTGPDYLLRQCLGFPGVNQIGHSKSATGLETAPGMHEKGLPLARGLALGGACLASVGGCLAWGLAS